MIVLALVVALQSLAAPILPPQTSPDLQKAFISIEEDLAASKFDSARSKLGLLPAKTITYQWNDSNVPVAQRPELIQVRNEALKTWTNRVPGLAFQQDKAGKLKFSFNDLLAKDPDSGLPRGVALFFSEDPSEARMEAVIGLKRGNPVGPTNLISFFNEIYFAAGSYMGLAPGLFPGTAMGRSDLQMQYRSDADVNELNALTQIRTSIEKLSQAVKQKQVLAVAKPQVTLSPDSIDRGPVVQGDPIEVSVQINNVGTSPVQYRLVPDCGCMTAVSGAPVAPNSSGIGRLHIDTSEIAGDFNKHLIVISNDIDRPVIKVPIHVRTIPRYRFLTENEGVLVVDESGLDTEIFLTSPESRPLNIKSIEMPGNTGTAQFEPWSGNLADPALNEAAKLRKGFRIKLHLEQPQVSGRSAASLVVKTDDPKFDTIRYTIFTQRGIAVLPSSVYLGELEKAPRESSFILSRPNRPFTISKIESDSSFVSSRFEMVKGNWEYKVIVTYNGKAPVGDLHATLTIFTSDGKQSKLRVPVMGTVQ